jgi:hypothetical protein
MVKQTFSASEFDLLVNSQTNKVIRMLAAWFIASAPHHNPEAFMFLGLIPVELDGRFFLTVHPEKLEGFVDWERSNQRERCSHPIPTFDFSCQQ